MLSIVEPSSAVAKVTSCLYPDLLGGHEGNFAVDDNGREECCRWCGSGSDDGGGAAGGGGAVQAQERLQCDSCLKSMCERCVERNFGAAELDRIKLDKLYGGWTCYCCDASSLHDHQSWLMRLITCAVSEKEEKRKRQNRKKRLRQKEKKRQDDCQQAGERAAAGAVGAGAGAGNAAKRTGLVSDLPGDWSVLGPWRVQDWSTKVSKQTESLSSETFEVSGRKWRIVLSGPSRNEAGYVGLFLGCPQSPEPLGCQNRARFILSIINQSTAAKSENYDSQEYEHAFDETQDWGLTKFLDASTLENPVSGFINVKDDSVMVAVYVQNLPDETSSKVISLKLRRTDLENDAEPRVLEIRRDAKLQLLFQQFAKLEGGSVSSDIYKFTANSRPVSSSSTADELKLESGDEICVRLNTWKLEKEQERIKKKEEKAAEEERRKRRKEIVKESAIMNALKKKQQAAAAVIELPKADKESTSTKAKDKQAQAVAMVDPDACAVSPVVVSDDGAVAATAPLPSTAETGMETDTHRDTDTGSPPSPTTPTPDGIIVVEVQDLSGVSTKFKIRRTQTIKKVVTYLEDHGVVEGAAQQRYLLNGREIDINLTPDDINLGPNDVICVAPPGSHDTVTGTEDATATSDPRSTQHARNGNGNGSTKSSPLSPKKPTDEEIPLTAAQKTKAAAEAADAQLDRERQERQDRRQRGKAAKLEREAAVKLEQEHREKANAEKLQQLAMARALAVQRRTEERARKKQAHGREVAAKRAEKKVEFAAVLKQTSAIQLDASIDEEALDQATACFEKLRRLAVSLRDDSAVLAAENQLAGIDRLVKQRRRRLCEVVGMQARARGLVERRHFLARREAAVTIQAAHRRHIAAQHYAVMLMLSSSASQHSDVGNHDSAASSSSESSFVSEPGGPAFEPRSSPVSPLWSPAKPGARMTDTDSAWAPTAAVQLRTDLADVSLDGLLSQLGLESLGPVLEENEVDVEALALMAPDDFMELGIDEFGTDAITGKLAELRHFPAAAELLQGRGDVAAHAVSPGASALRQFFRTGGRQCLAMSEREILAVFAEAQQLEGEQRSAF